MINFDIAVPSAEFTAMQTLLTDFEDTQTLQAWRDGGSVGDRPRNPKMAADDKAKARKLRRYLKIDVDDADSSRYRLVYDGYPEHAIPNKTGQWKRMRFDCDGGKVLVANVLSRIQEFAPNAFGLQATDQLSGEHLGQNKREPKIEQVWTKAQTKAGKVKRNRVTTITEIWINDAIYPPPFGFESDPALLDTTKTEQTIDADGEVSAENQVATKQLPPQIARRGVKDPLHYA